VGTDPAPIMEVSLDYVLRNGEDCINEEDQATIKNMIKAIIIKNQMESVISH
jgi:hypothetical protein